jgi:hypothetical protein
MLYRFLRFRSELRMLRVGLGASLIALLSGVFPNQDGFVTQVVAVIGCAEWSTDNG